MRNARRAVGAGHRRIDEMRDARGRRRTNDVDALACFRLRTALERRRHGEDGVDATRGALETFLILEVSGNDRDAALRERRGGGRVWLPRQRANRMPPRKQLAYKVAALLPRRARHEHVQLAGHVAPPFMTCLQQTASQAGFAASATAEVQTPSAFVAVTGLSPW